MKPFKHLKVLFLLSAVCMSGFGVHADESNLIVNGSFEELENGTPKGWQILEGASGSKAAFPNVEGKGITANVAITNDGKKGAYLAQWVKLEPNQNYRLSLKAMMTGGKLTFAIGNTGLNVRMFGQTQDELPMSPYFWDESWLNSVPFVPGQWREVSFDFNSKDVPKVLVTLGGFFAAGSYSFDDVTLEKIEK